MPTRFVLVVLAVGLIAAACGGDDQPAVASVQNAETVPPSTDAPPPADDPDAKEATTEQALLDLAACMRENGIDMEDPQFDASGNVRIGAIIRQASDADPSEIRAGLDACSEHLEGLTLGFRDFDLTELKDQMYEFAKCMRENGFDLPDPDFTNFGLRDGAAGQSGPFGEIDPDDSDFLTALESCEDILSFGRFGGGGRGGGGGNG